VHDDDTLMGNLVYEELENISVFLISK